MKSITALNKKGFAFIEILCSILILGIALVSCALVFSKCTALGNELEESMVAVKAAQEQMETIRNTPFDTITAMGSSFTFTAAGFSNLNSPVGTGAVTNPDGTPDMHRVTVMVGWTSSEGRARTKSLVTQVTRNGINRQ